MLPTLNSTKWGEKPKTLDLLVIPSDETVRDEAFLSTERRVYWVGKGLHRKIFTQVMDGIPKSYSLLAGRRALSFYFAYRKIL